MYEEPKKVWHLIMLSWEHDISERQNVSKHLKNINQLMRKGARQKKRWTPYPAQLKQDRIPIFAGR